MSQFRTKLFPFCAVPDSGVGDGTLYPVAVTLDKAMEWFWRVKLWTLTIDYTWNTFTFLNIQLTNDGTPPITERDLICFTAHDPPIPGIFVEGSDDYIDVGSGIDATVRWQLFLFSANASPSSLGSALLPDPWTLDALRTDGGSYWPQLLFMVDASGDGVPDDDASTYNGVGAAGGASLLSFDGNAIQMYYQHFNDFIGATWTPQEWWPYAPTSGGADVWDTATGAQLTGLTVID